MTTKDARGNKLKCQNEECDARFYDLNREPATCPICGTVYKVAEPPPPPEEPKKVEEKPESGATEGAEAKVDKDKDPDVEAAEELVDLDTDDVIADDDDSDTFLESDDNEDDSNVSVIVGDVKKDKGES